MFGEDIDATTEDLPAVLSFQHKLLQEYLAAVYIAENVKQNTADNFLEEAFPTWEKIESHREVVQFTCGILGETGASPVLNHVAKCLAGHIHKKLNNAVDHLPDTSILASCQKESGSFTINQHLSLYPSCNKPLDEVLANTELVHIDDIAENDTLQLNPRSAQIIVKLRSLDSGMHDEKYDRLWEALHSAHANVIALDLWKITSTNVTKLHNFPHIKHLSLRYSSSNDADMEVLAESIESWGQQPQLTFCYLHYVPIPGSLMTALCKCTKLLSLALQSCNLYGNLSVLMASPPQLRELHLDGCSLCGADVDHITEAIRDGRLNHLLMLNINFNHVGEEAVGSLLEALISTRPHTQIKLHLHHTGKDDDDLLSCLSDEFKTEWKTKLAGTNIDVEW